MLKFKLRYARATDGRDETLSFLAQSTAGALETAKLEADGDWAELYQDGQSICRLRLVEETGVWLIERVAEKPAE